MDYDARLAEVLALLQQETSEQYCGKHCLSAGRRELPLSISLQSEKAERGAPARLPPAFPSRLAQVLRPTSSLSVLSHLTVRIQDALPHAPPDYERSSGAAALNAARATRRALPRR